MSSIDPVGDAMRRLEQQERLLRQAASIDPFEHQRRLLLQGDQFRALEAAYRSWDVREDSLSRIRRQLEDADRWEQRIQQTLDGVDHARRLDQLVAGMSAASEEWQRRLDRQSGVADPFSSAVARIEEQSRRWQQLLQAAERSAGVTSTLQRHLLQSAAMAFEDSLQRATTIARRSDLQARFPTLAGRLLAPTQAFGDYAPAACARAAQDADAAEQDVVVASVALAESQVIASADLQDEWFGGDESPTAQDSGDGAGGSRAGTEVVPPGVGGPRASEVLIERVGPGRIAEFFLVQEADVRVHTALLVDPAGRAIAEVVPTARRSERQLEFCRLVRACNVDARMHHPGRDTPFAVGESVLGFFTEMGLIDGSSREGLGALIDGLYFTLYEATHKKRRLRPYLQDAQCAVVDRVCNLRNRVFRHNREREPAHVIALQEQELLSDLRALGLEGEPHTPEERVRLHDRLLGDAISTLSELREAVRR